MQTYSQQTTVVADFVNDHTVFAERLRGVLMI